jgi:hypothetical protein
MTANRRIQITAVAVGDFRVPGDAGTLTFVLPEKAGVRVRR